MCRSLAETVLVVLYDLSASPSAVDARSIFHEQPELSAVAFSNPDATRAAVVTYAHCVNRLVPAGGWYGPAELRSEEHTSELQSLMRISYAVFCLKKKKKTQKITSYTTARSRKTDNKQVEHNRP